MSSTSSINHNANNKQRPSQFYPQFFENLPSMQDKTVVITGCSRGIGYVTARAAAQKGAFVVMLNRKSAKAEESTATIAQESSKYNNPHQPLSIECDLLDFQSVRDAVQKVKKVAPAIDVLCCNAGIMLQPDEVSKDGYDITISANVLSHFSIVKELMPNLENAASLRGKARIVNMLSGSGYGAPPLDIELFRKRSNEAKMSSSASSSSRESYNRYHQSKLANLIFTKALHEKLQSKQSTIQVVACTPGVCGTDMFMHASTIMNGQPSPLDQVPSVEDGSMAQIKCICDFENVKSGDLWGPERGCKKGTLANLEIKPPLILVDDDAKRKLWKVCEDATGIFEL